jgi:hypothetical protein
VAQNNAHQPDGWRRYRGAGYLHRPDVPKLHGWSFSRQSDRAQRNGRNRGYGQTTEQGRVLKVLHIELKPQNLTALASAYLSDDVISRTWNVA